MKEDSNSRSPNHEHEIFMAILSEPKNRKDNSAEQADLDYDDFLHDEEAAEAALSYEIPPSPPGVTVTVHLNDKNHQLKEIYSQKKITKHSFISERRQQLGDSFDYSNSDLCNVINIGRNARTVIINRSKEHKEVEAYSPTSNYRLPDIHKYSSRK